MYFSGPEIYFTKFWYVFEEVIWHYMLKEQISTWLGAGKGCIFLNVVYIVLYRIRDNE